MSRILTSWTRILNLSSSNEKKESKVSALFLSFMCFSIILPPKETDAIDETEGTLEGNVAHLNSLNELVEKYKREAQIARKEADVGSNIILSEEASKAEDDKLDSTKSNRKPTSVISQVLPSEGIKAAREVFEQIYQKPMASDKVMETIEK